MRCVGKSPKDIIKPGPGSEAVVTSLQQSEWDPVLKSPSLSVASPELETNLLIALLLCAHFLLGLHPELRLSGCNS